MVTIFMDLTTLIATAYKWWKIARQSLSSHNKKILLGQKIMANKKIILGWREYKVKQPIVPIVIN